MLKKIILIFFISLFSLSGGIVIRGVHDASNKNGITQKKLEGLWKVGKEYTFDHNGAKRWKEEKVFSKAFYQFRRGESCSQYKASPEFFCIAYAPYILQGNVLTIFRDVSEERYRFRFLTSQLELIKEEWYNNEWVPISRTILIKISESSI